MVLFQTLTGLTGIALYTIVCIIFVFAHPLVRKKAYNFFWLSHQLYVLLYILSLLHGLARLTAEPRFWLFLVVPGMKQVAKVGTNFGILDIESIVFW